MKNISLRTINKSSKGVQKIYKKSTCFKSLIPKLGWLGCLYAHMTP